MKRISHTLFGVFLLMVLIFSVAISSRNTTTSYRPLVDQEVAAEEDSTDVALSPEVIQKFDLIGDGYHLLYEELALPNTLEQVTPPEITGDEEADKRIRQVAEDRGYVLQRIVTSEAELQPVTVFDVVQKRAHQDWLELSREAEKEGIEIRVVSGFRDIEEQRQLFMSRLLASGASVAGIRSGVQDDIIGQVLTLVAPPGYSRHHTGYTVDVGSGDGVFLYSAGYNWISKDNYSKALSHGFIPSYPEDAVDQGPEPEPWEFVWVGKDLIEAQIEP